MLLYKYYFYFIICPVYILEIVKWKGISNTVKYWIIIITYLRPSPIGICCLVLQNNLLSNRERHYFNLSISWDRDHETWSRYRIYRRYWCSYSVGGLDRDSHQSTARGHNTSRARPEYHKDTAICSTGLLIVNLQMMLSLYDLRY